MYFLSPMKSDIASSCANAICSTSASELRPAAVVPELREQMLAEQPHRLGTLILRHPRQERRPERIVDGEVLVAAVARLHREPVPALAGRARHEGRRALLRFG